MKGVVVIEIMSAAPEEMLNSAAGWGIVLDDICQIDALTVRAKLQNSQFPLLRRLLIKRGERCVLVERLGVYWRIIDLVKRPFLFSTILLLFISTWYLPSKVLFVEVVGNAAISDAKILSVAETCGIRMWASRTDVRSEKVKNKLLMLLPQLKWAGINTKGCTAVITVQERDVPIEERASKVPHRISALSDGIITEMTVTKGVPMCQVGDAVSKGQILVSPYVESELSVKYTGAEGEIFADTQRELSGFLPISIGCKDENEKEHIRISLLFGKNKINLYNGSGNCSGVCDMIYKESYLSLPGGFRLPVAIVTERTVCRNENPADLPPDADNLLKNGTESYLLSQMISGRIMFCETEFLRLDEGLLLNARYSCSEMIGKIEAEEVVPNEQRN